MNTPLWKCPKSERGQIKQRLREINDKIQDSQNTINHYSNVIQYHQHKIETLQSEKNKLVQQYELTP